MIQISVSGIQVSRVARGAHQLMGQSHTYGVRMRFSPRPRQRPEGRPVQVSDSDWSAHEATTNLLPPTASGSTQAPRPAGGPASDGAAGLADARPSAPASMASHLPSAAAACALRWRRIARVSHNGSRICIGHGWSRACPSGRYRDP